jgi:hypothetical protein
MLIRDVNLNQNGCCHECNAPATILYISHFTILLCTNCAIQVSRKLLEDVCALKGDRHG